MLPWLLDLLQPDGCRILDSMLIEIKFDVFQLSFFFRFCTNNNIYVQSYFEMYMNSLGATRITTLKIQYRMHPDICELISRKFYDDAS